MGLDKCSHCGMKKVKVNLQIKGELLHLCNDCYNKMMSDELNVNLEQVIESFTLVDGRGISRTFYVERRVYPIGFYFEAVENIEFGYKFAVHGELEGSQQEMISRLIEKTRKGIAEQYIETDVFSGGQAYQNMKNDQIVGVIEYNEASDDEPLVIIDGKPYTWEEVGKMVTAFEGFQIKLKMYDITDDVE